MPGRKLNSGNLKTKDSRAGLERVASQHYLLRTNVIGFSLFVNFPFPRATMEIGDVCTRA